MKSFKEYHKDKEGESILSYPSSFREVNPEKESILSWDSSFREVKPDPKKTSQVSEAAIKKGKSFEWADTTLMDAEHHTGFNNQDASYNVKWHHHPDNSPLALSSSHRDAIRDYVQTPSENTSRGHASSANMNGYLRNLSGEKNQGIKGGHDSKNVVGAIKRFSGAFTPENTNKKPITTYGGVPEHIGRKLATSKIGSKHTLSGFTSTSLSKATGKSYGESYKEYEGPGRRERATHVIQYHVEPGAGLSTAPHSKYSENEVTLHHGAHTTYNGSERHRDENGQPLIVHHVTVHNTHKPLEDYQGTYNHPKGL